MAVRHCTRAAGKFQEATMSIERALCIVILVVLVVWLVTRLT